MALTFDDGFIARRRVHPRPEQDRGNSPPLDATWGVPFYEESG